MIGNQKSERDWKKITTIGLIIGAVVGLVRIFSLTDMSGIIAWGLGIAFSGITAASIIARIAKRKIFSDSESGF